MYITKKYTVKEHYKLTKPWDAGFPKVLFLFNTFHILCRDEGKTFLGFVED